jgi:hypothetical protein
MSFCRGVRPLTRRVRTGRRRRQSQVRGPKSHTVIAFSYLLLIVYALTLAPVAWVYAVEVWSLEAGAPGMVRVSHAFYYPLEAFSLWVFSSHLVSQTSRGNSSPRSVCCALVPRSEFSSR